MKHVLKLFMLVLASLLFSCPSDDNDDDNCTKIITIPQSYYVNGEAYYLDREQEVSCDFPDVQTPEVIEPVVLENFSYEVLNFIYTPDTGNNTSRLQFDIQLNNLGNMDVNGFGAVSFTSITNDVSMDYSMSFNNVCTQLEANSSCILSFDEETSLDLGAPSSIELVDVVYYLTN